MRYHELVCQIQAAHELHLTSKPSEQVSESAHAKGEEEGAKEGEPGHDGPTHDEHHDGNHEQGAEEEEECGREEDGQEHGDGLSKEGGGGEVLEQGHQGGGGHHAHPLLCAVPHRHPAAQVDHRTLVLPPFQVE